MIEAQIKSIVDEWISISQMDHSLPQVKRQCNLWIETAQIWLHKYAVPTNMPMSKNQALLMREVKQALHHYRIAQYMAFHRWPSFQRAFQQCLRETTDMDLKTQICARVLQICLLDNFTERDHGITTALEQAYG